MCQSVEATSVCTIADPRSVIVPRRPDKTLLEKNGLLHWYSQLAKWSLNSQFDPEANDRRSSSVLVPSFEREDEGKKDPSSGRCGPIKQLTLGTSSPNNVFQVRDMSLMQCLLPFSFAVPQISKCIGETSK